jgi:leucyl-tRNA synthetase
MKKYNHKKIEPKWQKKWEKEKLHQAKDFSDKPKYYALVEFPYPSGDGLHAGHVRSYTAMDIVARKRRMDGYNVLYPIGWDAFGLPTENYAIKMGIHPKVVTKKNTDTFRRQLKSLGFSFDWEREINTTDPKYYKWTQWIFLQLYKHGLAYKKKMPINWCLSCKVGLANEEVVDGKCERCGGNTEKRNKEQWLLAITKYADKLLEDLKTVDYLEKIKIQQANWIGRSEGAEILFRLQTTDHGLRSNQKAVDGSPSAVDHIKVFTTRPDTLFGATYMVISPEHKIIEDLKSKIENFDEVKKYLEEAKKKSELERTELQKEKTGVELKGVKAINPANGEEIPIWAADYVLSSYGTGAIMAVPAHDERDFEFAKKYNLPIRNVVTTKKDDVAGAGALIKAKNGKFLFQKRDGNTNKNPGMIGPFGGAAESGEDTKQVLKREVKEELNLEVKDNFRLINKFESHNEPGEYFDIFYIENVDEENMKLGEGEAIVELDLLEALARKDVTLFTKEIIKYFQENKCFIENGINKNSDFLDGLETPVAKEKMTQWLEEKGLGKRQVNFHLRDWIFSRQHYWGEPIPIVFCDKCGEVPIPEKDLPVKLPDVKNYEPTDTGESPLAGILKWVKTKCPKCGGLARRETDTMPNWAGSSWYFLRYIDPKNDKEFASRKKLDYWAPIDWYNGGMEHTTLHLLYSRFWNKFLFDIGAIPNSEPYQKRTSQGMVLGAGGVKMSKSKGNVVNPDSVIANFGADTLRLYEMFMGPFDQAIPWDEKGLNGCNRFLVRLWELSTRLKNKSNTNEDLERLLHKTIKKVGEDIESMSFNTAVSSLMIFANECYKLNEIPQNIWEKFLIILAPFAPFIAEELWLNLGYKKSIHLESWPKFDPCLIQDKEIEIVVQINGKVRDRITVAAEASEEEIKKIILVSEKVKQWTGGQEPKKIIYVKGKLVSIVV